MVMLELPSFVSIPESPDHIKSLLLFWSPTLPTTFLLPPVQASFMAVENMTDPDAPYFVSIYLQTKLPALPVSICLDSK
jgi:hypothetical protein